MNSDDSRYFEVLKDEMVMALGCTEPIAIAYAAAKAREVLGAMPDSAIVWCSGNIVKNVKSVTVPNSGGMTGIEVAAVLGILGGNAGKKLEVLSDITEEHRIEARRLIAEGFCRTKIQPEVDNLYVRVCLKSGQESSEVTIMYRHTLIWEISRNNVTIYKHENIDAKKADRSFLSVHGIIRFAETASFDKLKECFGEEILRNTAISREGLEGHYGAEIGRTLLGAYGDDVRFRAVAAAAAGSDARMNGCALPVVINSGSGNQGMAVSLPVLVYARHLGVSEGKTYRALAISNLISIHIKKNIGDLSAFCGAVSAACGAGAAITYLHGGTEAQIGNTIINTLANVGGLICDGAKSSCAAKIATSVNAAILAHEMSMKGIVFRDGDGIVQPDVEQTIKSIGHIGKTGMAKTDEEVLKIMLGEVRFD